MKTCKRCNTERQDGYFYQIQNKYWTKGKLVSSQPYNDKVCVFCRRKESAEAQKGRYERLNEWRKENGIPIPERGKKEKV